MRDANVIADKGYDSGALVELIHARNCVAVIPSRAHWARRRYDAHVYKERFLVECFFQKIKRCRRIAMRFESWLLTSWAWCSSLRCSFGRSEVLFRHIGSMGST